MHILVSAFAFAPNTGSEPGVGWRWAMELAREHQVTVITDISRAAKVAPELQRAPPANLRVVYWRPALLRRLPLNSRTAHLQYILWQFLLLPVARRLHRQRQFDLAIHLTYGVFRHPSFLGYLGVPFVFGPVGGGEDAPWALKQSLSAREKLKELARGLANRLAGVDPLLRLALRRADLVLAKTDQTVAALPAWVRDRAVVFPEIGVDTELARTVCARAPGAPLRVLFAGRLLGWKGAHLALRAVAGALARGADVHLTLVGSGPYAMTLHALADRLGLDAGRITWLSHVPQTELFALYARSHCFVFPSLHDSSGNVVLEAQSFGLPVICLDLGGPSTLVSRASAWVVDTGGRDETAVVEGIADGLVELAGNEPRRVAMGEHALDVARRATWSGRVEGMLALVAGGLPTPPCVANAGQGATPEIT